LGAGDSFLLVDFMSAADAAVAFAAVSGETPWGSFNIRGGAVPRDVCTMGVPEQSQAAAGGGAASSLNWPLYRHPIDAHPAMHPWVPSVASIVSRAQEATGETINHGLIQRYHSGENFISDHTDKTLDIKRGACCVVNVSLGATRTLVLKSKDKKRKQEVELPSGSLYVLGWQTNMEWLHAIKRVGDPKQIVMPRVSLTLRNIATYQRDADGRLYGQSARHKTEASLEAALAREKRLRAFGWASSFSCAGLSGWMASFKAAALAAGSDDGTGAGGSTGVVQLVKDHPRLAAACLGAGLASVAVWRTVRWADEEKDAEAKEDAKRLFHRFGAMNKEVDAASFTIPEGEPGIDAVTYNQYDTDQFS
jgi:alkylated DNA repair dioxygenase AlkB